MNKILVVAGTSDARELIELLLAEDYHIVATTATEYGKSVLPCDDKLTIISGRLNEDAFVDLMNEQEINVAVDMTHPFAVEVSVTVKSACDRFGASYIHYRRPNGNYDYDKVIYVDSYDEMIALLEKIDGNIFLTIGSNNLHKFVAISDYKQRIYVRVLKDRRSLDICHDMGLDDSHVYTMTTVPSLAENIDILRSIAGKVIVTKDSGVKGGIIEKIDAAREMNIPIIILRRPDDIGLNDYDEILNRLREVLNV